MDEFSLRAGGASYEELHAAGGGILSTVRATRAAGEDGLRAAVELHRSWMLREGTTTFEAKSGYGLDRETELASLRAIRDAGGIPTWLGAHAVPPEFADADAYLDFALAEVLPEAAELAEAADVFLERGAFDAAQARRYLEACRDAGLALRLHGDQFTESGAIPLAVELAARSVDHLEATGEEGIRALASSDVVGVLLPASALFLDRPMPPARALVDAGAAVALATDFNPGSAFCESLPLVCSLAATQLHLSPAEALAACTVNAAHVLGRADRHRPARARLPRRRHAPRRARLALPRVPPRRPRSGQGGRRGRATLALHADEEAAAPGAEGTPARVRDRLGRRRGQRARGAARGAPPPAAREARTAAEAQGARRLSSAAAVPVRVPPPPSWRRADRSVA